jgi:hypothetical protein
MQRIPVKLFISSANSDLRASRAVSEGLFVGATVLPARAYSFFYPNISSPALVYLVTNYTIILPQKTIINHSIIDKAI